MSSYPIYPTYVLFNDFYLQLSPTRCSSWDRAQIPSLWQTSLSMNNPTQFPTHCPAFELTCKAEELLCVRGKAGGDVHGWRLTGEKRVKGWRSGRCQWGRWERWGFILDVGQLALPGVTNGWLAFPLCSMHQEEGLNCRLQHCREEHVATPKEQECLEQPDMPTNSHSHSQWAIWPPGMHWHILRRP